MSEAQLTLVPTTSSRFSIDARTRQVGRAGIAAARELLRSAAVPGERPEAASHAA